MSEQDEALTIGWLAKELSDARKQYALTKAFLETFADNLDTISRVCRNPENRSDLATGLAAISRLVNGDALASAQQAIRELAEQSEKLQRIEKRVREAGLSL